MLKKAAAAAAVLLAAVLFALASPGGNYPGLPAVQDGFNVFTVTQTFNAGIVLGSGASITGSGFPLTKSISVQNPSSSENDTIFYTSRAITITEIRCVITGTTSATYKVSFGTSRASGTDALTAVACSNSTTGATATLTNTAVSAASYVWLVTTALSGTPTELHVDVTYTNN